MLIPGLPRTQETQGIFKLKKVSGKLKEFFLFFKLKETQGNFDFF